MTQRADRLPAAPPAARAADPEIARQRLRLWLQMLKSVRHVEAVVRERLRQDYTTTLPRFDVLAMLDRRPAGLRMSELSRQLMVSNGNVTGIVDRLEQEGLVSREAVAGDRRATLVRLTAQGKALMDEMVTAHAGWIDELLGGLDEAEVARAIATMIEIRRS